jgi:DUF1680 family protein
MHYLRCDYKGLKGEVATGEICFLCSRLQVGANFFCSAVTVAGGVRKRATNGLNTLMQRLCTAADVLNEVFQCKNLWLMY